MSGGLEQQTGHVLITGRTMQQTEMADIWAMYCMFNSCHSPKIRPELFIWQLWWKKKREKEIPNAYLNICILPYSYSGENKIGFIAGRMWECCWVICSGSYPAFRFQMYSMATTMYLVLQKGCFRCSNSFFPPFSSSWIISVFKYDAGNTYVQKSLVKLKPLYE